MVPVKTIIVGEEIPSLTKTAYIIENPKALNPIHSHDYARAHGMRGALDRFRVRRSQFHSLVTLFRSIPFGPKAFTLLAMICFYSNTWRLKYIKSGVFVKLLLKNLK